MQGMRTEWKEVFEILCGMDRGIGAGDGWGSIVIIMYFCVNQELPCERCEY